MLLSTEIGDDRIPSRSQSTRLVMTKAGEITGRNEPCKSCAPLWK